MFEDNLNTTSVSFFIADFNLLSCEFDSFTFTTVALYHFILIKIKLYFALNGIAFNEVALAKLLRFLVKSPKQFLLIAQ